MYIYIYELFVYINMASNPSSLFGTATNAEQLAVWHSAIHVGLSLRKNGATEMEVQRLAKTLKRLQATAESAMASQASADTASVETIMQALNVLGRG